VPLRQITGESEFNQVYLDEVRVPLADVVGDIGDGWRVARQHLVFERSMGEGGSRNLAGELVRDLLAAARRAGVPGDPKVVELLGEAMAIERAQRHLTSDVLDGMRTGRLSPDSTSIMKLAVSLDTQRLGE